ncbi:ATP-binding cassette domain-containing protein [Acuticoccus sediminis]|uniref:ATP-binding cassette domain-containing protein n=1 Tax=Acuticoccus sediminis TaxID=2184697 RepID=UPI001CFD7E3C|nr:ATP-binding cassette domain-containing protein [Acuticoccus sediminis]
MPEALRPIAPEPGASVVPLAAPLVEARDVTFAVRGRRLVDGVRLAVRPGRSTVVLGANGAGKSLLLRLLHGLIAPTGGAVLWRGSPLDRAARRHQAMVFQRPVMLRRSARANVAFALGVRGIASRDRVDEALERARLTALAAQPARLLSGGEQQRLALARALVTEPELLFLDEPTASLDPASTHAIEGLIDDARAAGVTIVMVTHDRGQAERLADDVVFLHRGRVAEHGPASRVLDAPQSEPFRAWLDGRLYLDPA